MAKALPSCQHRARHVARAGFAISAAVAAAAGSGTAEAFLGVVLAPLRLAAPATWLPAKGAPRTTPALRAIVGGCGPFLVYEELKTPRPRRNVKRRRGKLWEYKDGVWVKLEEPVPEIEPSEEPRELARQLGEARQAGCLLPFLEAALAGPAFGASHVALAVHTLVAQQQHMRPAAVAAMREHPAIATLALRGRQLMEASSERLDAWLVASALRGVAQLSPELPELRSALAVPLAQRALEAADEMIARQVAWVVWATAELWEHFGEAAPELQEALLPRFLSEQRWQGIRTYLRRAAPEEDAIMRRALLKLKREVPQLREVLPAT